MTFSQGSEPQGAIAIRGRHKSTSESSRKGEIQVYTDFVQTFLNPYIILYSQYILPSFKSLCIAKVLPFLLDGCFIQAFHIQRSTQTKDYHSVSCVQLRWGETNKKEMKDTSNS